MIITYQVFLDYGLLVLIHSTTFTNHLSISNYLISSFVSYLDIANHFIILMDLIIDVKFKISFYLLHKIMAKTMPKFLKFLKSSIYLHLFIDLVAKYVLLQNKNLNFSFEGQKHQLFN